METFETQARTQKRIFGQQYITGCRRRVRMKISWNVKNGSTLERIRMLLPQLNFRARKI